MLPTGKSDIVGATPTSLKRRSPARATRHRFNEVEPIDANGTTTLYAAEKPPKKAPPPTPDYDRLCGAIRAAGQSLQVYRENRREIVREFVGARWSEDGARKPVYLNLISLFVQIVGRNLISKNPKVMLSTFDRAKKPDVDRMETWANDRIVEMDLAGSLRRVVTDALFSIGVMKVALATPDDAMRSGWNISAGVPFAEGVDLDDFVIDMKVKDFRHATFVGHRLRVPKAAAEARWGKKKLKGMATDAEARNNAAGDERVGEMGRGSYGADDDFEECYTVWEIYLPRYRLVCVLADDGGGNPAAGIGDEKGPLEVKEWLGPDCGPYHFLSLGLVPGNPMGKAPLMDLIDLHEAFNRALRKLVRQADRMKSVTAVGLAASEDGERMKNAADGDMVQCNSVDQIRQVESGGPNPALFTFMLQLKELFSWAAGNLDLMGGLSPQSKTAAQDKMLNENSARSVADMQESTVTFTGAVLKSMCWYWWNHPQLRMVSSYSPPGVPDVSITRTLTPLDRRRTRYADMNVRVDPYSLLHSTPQAKAAALNQIVQQVIAPLMVVLREQGVAFDVHAFLTSQADFLDLPELLDMVTVQEPPSQGPRPPGGTGEAPGMPANTSRTYTRENVSDTTSQGRDMAMANAMSGTDSGGDPNG